MLGYDGAAGYRDVGGDPVREPSLPAHGTSHPADRDYAGVCIESCRAETVAELLSAVPERVGVVGQDSRAARDKLPGSAR